MPPAIALPETTRPPAGLEDVARTVMEQLPETRAWLEELITIPSISAASGNAQDVRASALRTARCLTDAGLENVELLEVEGAHPYVTGDWLHAGEQAPTVLLYAHHDVQPVGTPERWSTEPFTPTERTGRLFARGAADDKAGIMAHVAAVRAWLTARGSLPVNVKVIVEGEEEIGSPHLEEFLRRHGERLRAGVIVLTDLVNWKVGWPGLTTTLRGMADATVSVRSLEQPVHSGMWGGPVPDALTGMSHLLASLHHPDGSIAVPGFADDVRELSAAQRRQLAALAEDPAAIREEVRMLDGVAFVGDPEAGLLERMWARPTITPTGMDVPDVANASNTLVSKVSAKLSCRLAPGQDPDRAMHALRDHLERAAPWGLHVEVHLGERNAAWETRADGPAFAAAVAAMTAAYGREPAILGSGGSIPFVEPFSQAFDDAACLLVGIEDPASNAHGEDESLHLGDFTHSCLTETFLLAGLAEHAEHRDE